MKLPQRVRFGCNEFNRRNYLKDYLVFCLIFSQQKTFYQGKSLRFNCRGWEKTSINFASGNQRFEFQSFGGHLYSLSPCLVSEIISPYILSYDLQVAGLRHKNSKSIVSLWKSCSEFGLSSIRRAIRVNLLLKVVFSTLYWNTNWNNFPRVFWRLVTERRKGIRMEFWKVIKGIRVWPW